VNPAATSPAIAITGRVPRDQAPRSPEPTRFRLLHHANVVVTSGDSYRMRQARAKGGTTLKSELTNPRGGDFYLATTGDCNLAVDTLRVMAV
jgi:hypothetical protein